MSLPSLQTLIIASSRSNSPNTAANAASARESSDVHAVRATSVPIAACERFTRWAAPVATGARLHAAVSAPDMKNAHAARTDGVTAGARQARGREADRLPCV